MKGKSRFALYFGNRGFFPASLQKTARDELTSLLTEMEYETLAMPFDATRSGAVETLDEGRKYARFLHENRGKYDGVILALPNFGDENGTMAAFRDCDVPVFVLAYPDDMDKMGPATRRDSFCGKMSIMDVFVQCGINFTALKPHTVRPGSQAFKDNIDYFDRLCRVVRDIRALRIGAIGARTTAFKTVRWDEVALQKRGVTTETYDLSELFARVDKLTDADGKVKDKLKFLGKYASWDGVPDAAKTSLAKLGTAVDAMVEDYGLDCVAIRCWNEVEERLGVAPCVLLSEMNERGVIASCELDVGNALVMRALRSASGSPACCLDWNNNYNDEENKCILFHCGPVPQSMMVGKGKIGQHAILATSMDPACTYGCDIGRIKPMPMTYGSLLTRDGESIVYLGEGRFTADPIPDDFFGCAGVAEFPDMQEMLQQIGYMGFRHHASVTSGTVMAPTAEALAKYLGYEVILF